MKIVQSAFVLALVTGVFATPVLQDSSNEITKPLTEGRDVIYGIIGEKREAELDFSPKLNHLEARAQIKDTKCPNNGKTYTKADITRAVEAENNSANPNTYNNVETEGPLFQTTEQLYKARLDRKQQLPLQ
jgi:hypothetical protein